MRAKEYLSQLGRLERQIIRRKKHLEVLKTDITYMKGMSYDGVRVQTSPSGESQATKQIEQIVDIEAQLTREITRYHHMRRKITLEIERLPDDRFRDILMMRYVEGMSLQEIADEMGYAYQTTRRLHGFALCKFEKTMKIS